MRDWRGHFGLIEVRKASGRRVWERPGDYVLITREVAMPAARYAALPPWEQATARAAAVALTMDTAVVIGSAALRLWDIDVAGWRQPHIDVSHVDGKKAGPATTPGVRFRHALLPSGSVHVEHGMRVAVPARALRDVAVHDGIDAAVPSIDAVRRKWPSVGVGKLESAMLAGPPFHGIGRVREALALSVPDSGSVRESQVRLELLRMPAVTSVERQVRFVDPATGRVMYVDLRVNRWLLVEVDGEEKYDGTTYGPVDEVIREERRREKTLQNMGNVLVRVSDPADTRAIVSDALERWAHLAGESAA